MPLSSGIASGGGSSTSQGATEATLQQVLTVLNNIDLDGDALANIVTELQTANTNLSNIEVDTAAIEASLDSVITEIQNGNTANATNLSNLLTSSNNILAAINTSNTDLGNVITAIQTADTNNTTEINNLQTALEADLQSILTQLQAVNVNTDDIEAALTTLNTSINNNTTTTVAELQNIETLLNSSLAQQTTTANSLTTANTTLTSILNTLTNVQGLVATDFNETGTNTYTAPYRSISITALSSDVTVNDVALPEGLGRTSGSNDNEQQTANVTVTGTSYYVTLVKNV